MEFPQSTIGQIIDSEREMVWRKKLPERQRAAG
jgi:hypothetical protein